MLKKAMVTVIVLLTCAVPLSVSAQEPAPSENFMDKFNPGYEEGAILGMGVRVSTRPYEDVDASVFPVPILNAQYKRMFVEGYNVGVYLNRDEKFKIAAILAPRFWGFEPDDSSALTNMEQREWTIEGGLRGTLESDLFETQLSFVTDMMGEHDGQELALTLKKEFLGGGIKPRVGVKWLSDNLVDHYFGVNGNEARPGRPAYEADHTVNFLVGTTLALPIGDDWAWVTDGQVQILGEEITDSPIVEDETILTVVTGVVYRY